MATEPTETDGERRRELRTYEIRRIAQEAAEEAIETYRQSDPLLLWASARMGADAERRAMWKKIRESVLGQIVLYAVVGLGWAVWHFVTTKAKNES